MSPDSPQAGPTRRAWRALSALALLLGAVNFYLTLGLWSKQTAHTEKAVCATVEYAERQAFNLTGNPRASAELLKLADDMRATGIECPPRERPGPTVVPPDLP